MGQCWGWGLGGHWHHKTRSLWGPLWQSSLHIHNNARPRPSENAPRSRCLSLSAPGHLLFFFHLLLLNDNFLETQCVWIWLNYSSVYDLKHSARLEVCACSSCVFLDIFPLWFTYSLCVSAQTLNICACHWNHKVGIKKPSYSLHRLVLSWQNVPKELVS